MVEIPPYLPPELPFQTFADLFCLYFGGSRPNDLAEHEPLQNYTCCLTFTATPNGHWGWVGRWGMGVGGRVPVSYQLHSET